MPSFVNPDKCDGCKALDKTACQYICPNDLMVLNKDSMKAYNREPEMCWECYNFVPMGASVVPLRSTDSIMWTVKFRNGMLKRFKFPIRTTPEGKAQPTGGFETKPSLEGPVLFTEPDSLGLSDVWTK